MGDELNSLGSLITAIGIPALFFVVFCYALFKLIPKWVDVWRDNKEAERHRKNEETKMIQEYYNERNHSYTEQTDRQNQIMEMMNSQIGQATAVINRSNEVIAANTEAVKQNTTMHDRVISVLDRDIEATRQIVETLRTHDQRSEKICTDVQRILDKI